MPGNDLINRIAEKARASNSTSTNTGNCDLIVSLPVNAIKYHPKNHLYFKDLEKAMKDKLMDDMQNHGQINPIIVKKIDDTTYTVLAGHQRLIAARRLNWLQIKAIVIEISDFEAERLLIRDNLFRRHMGGMELAHALEAYTKLSDNQTKKSIRQIAEELGENRNTVHFYMRLNNLIPEFQNLIDEKKLSATTAQIFASMNQDEQKQVFEAMGDSIAGMKKKELEEEIRQQFQDKLEAANNEKVKVESENNNLLSEIENKSSDLSLYKNQAESYRQQAEELKAKAFSADIDEEAKTALSKINVLDSVIASICLSTIERYDSSTLELFEGKLKIVFSNLSNLLNLISDTKINISNTGMHEVETQNNSSTS
jgi:ParB/RepB/Spo0J family partition protein